MKATEAKYGYVSDEGSGALLHRVTSALGGLVVSFTILFLISKAQKTDAYKPSPKIEDIRSVVLPPPPVQDETIDPPPPQSFLGLEVSHSNSATRLRAAPGISVSNPKPDAVLDLEFNVESYKPEARNYRATHVFDRAEVDQIPVTLRKSASKMKSIVRDMKVGQSIVLLFIVSIEGNIVEPRVLETTSPEFTKAVMEDLKSWRMKPAVLDGEIVRCWVRQRFTVMPPSKSPFSTGGQR